MTSRHSRLRHRAARLFRFRRVQTRLIILFSLAFAVTIVTIELIGFFGLPFTSYGGILGQRRTEAGHNLAVIADLKSERLRYWMGERRQDAAVLAKHLLHSSHLSELCFTVRRWKGDGVPRAEFPERLRNNAAAQNLTLQLQDLVNLSNEYTQLLVADAWTGAVIGCTTVESIGSDMQQRQRFIQPLKRGGEFTRDIHLASSGSGLALTVSQVAYEPSREPLAVIMVEVRIDDILQSLAGVDGALDQRYEIVLLDSERHNLVTLKPSASRNAIRGLLATQIDSEPALRATGGENGMMETTDYRGTPVLAVYRHVEVAPGVAWGLVVKRDLHELYAPIYRDAVKLGIICALGIMAIVLLTMLVAQSVARPMRALAQTARAVAGGDFTARAPVTTADEVGALAHVFNSMIAQIQRDRETILRQERLAAIGQLTATVSHEIRNPLGTLRTSFFLLAERLRGKDPALTPIFARIERSIARCDAIIADLLDFSRLRPPDRRSTDIDAWLEVTLKEYELPPGITLRRELTSNARLDIDRERLRRSMVNLLTNACQAMEPNGGTITVTTRRCGQRIEICVADTGCGIAADQIPQVFEPLFSTKPFGIGLGLPMVKQVVQQHGGDIALHSAPGEGAVVSFWLPVPTQEETS